MRWFRYETPKPNRIEPLGFISNTEPSTSEGEGLKQEKNNEPQFTLHP